MGDRGLPNKVAIAQNDRPFGPDGHAKLSFGKSTATPASRLVNFYKDCKIFMAMNKTEHEILLEIILDIVITVLELD